MHRYNCFSAPITDVGSTECVHLPVVLLTMSDERADTDDGVIDVLGEPVTEDEADILVRLSIEIVGSANPRRSGTVSRSQTMTLLFMGVDCDTGQERREGDGAVRRATDPRRRVPT